MTTNMKRCMKMISPDATVWFTIIGLVKIEGNGEKNTEKIFQ